MEKNRKSKKNEKQKQLKSTTSGRKASAWIAHIYN
jgi:hypothetical protein